MSESKRGKPIKNFVTLTHVLIHKPTYTMTWIFTIHEPSQKMVALASIQAMPGSVQTTTQDVGRYYSERRQRTVNG